jgi:hypothetical protein
VLRREPLAEFMRARELHLDGRPDAAVLEYAAAEGFLVVSHDVNTMRAEADARLSDGRAMAGLLLVRQSVPVLVAIENLIVIWAASEGEEWQGRVKFLPL